MAIRVEEIDVDGWIGTRSEVRDGHAPIGGDPHAYEYFVNLSPGQRCETSNWFYARTESDDPGHFDENREVFDRMMGSLRFRASD